MEDLSLLGQLRRELYLFSSHPSLTLSPNERVHTPERRLTFARVLLRFPQRSRKPVPHMLATIMLSSFYSQKV